MSDLVTYFRALEEEEYAEAHANKWKESLKNEAEINETETGKEAIRQNPPKRTNKTKSWCFGKRHKTDKPLGKLAGRGVKTQINTIRKEKGAVTTDTNEAQKVIRSYLKKQIFRDVRKSERSR